MTAATITERERAIWRAAITLANNICVQESDRENEKDGDPGVIGATAECAQRIRAWAEPEDVQLAELLAEAGVPSHPPSEAQLLAGAQVIYRVFHVAPTIDEMRAVLAAIGRPR